MMMIKSMNSLRDVMEARCRSWGKRYSLMQVERLYMKVDLGR